MSNTPSDAEIDEVTLDVLGYAALDKETNETARMIARAVLAKWDSPQPVVREPLTEDQRSDIATAAAGFNWTDDYVEAIDYVIDGVERAHGITQKGGR